MENDIRPAAYTALASLTAFKNGPVDPVVETIAEEYSQTLGKVITPAQILLKVRLWAIYLQLH